MGKIFCFGSDVDTDQIIASQYLLYPSVEEMAPHCFESLDENFAPAVREGDFVVARDNFGCGSSREHAPVAIKASGIPVVIAANFARIFYRNGINIGLPLLEIGKDVERIHAGDKLSVDVTTGEIKDETTGETFHAHPLPGFVQEIADAGGLINYIKNKK